MSNSTGPAFLLKIGNGATPPTYQTVAGLRATNMAINGDISSAVSPSGGWRILMSGEGTRSISISATGIFLGSDAESEVRSHALAGTIADYELSFEDGLRIRGPFLVQRLYSAGDWNGERNHTLHLESAGPVVPA